MKIMFVNQSLQIGGAEKQIFTMAKGFNGRKDIEVSIFVLKKESGFNEDIGSELMSAITYSDIKTTEIWPLKPILRAVSVIRAARKLKPDVIYARVMPLPCTIAGKLLGIPVVVAEIANPSKSLKIVKPALHHLQTFIVRKTSRKLATRVVANCCALADEAKRFWKLKRRPSVIHNGLDFGHIEKKSAEAATHPWTKDGQTPLIVSAGRIAPQKGFGNLIDAFAIVAETTDVRLMILGGRELDGERERLLAQIKMLNLGDRVLLAGEKPNPYPFMKAADVYVSSSLYEGFSNSLLEALALGVPVVSTDHKFGANEIIEDGKSGILVPVSDPRAMAEAILQVLEDGKLRQTLSKNALERARRFSVERNIKEYEKLFREVVGG